MSRRAATLTGLAAILLWSLLALFTVGSAPVPPFLLNVMCFATGGAIGLIWIATGRGFGILRGVSWRVYAFGTAGLFGYHALYFTAFRMASPAGVEAQAGLIAYLWPLFIVLLSGLLPGERLRRGHVIGALVALAGAALIVLRGGVGTGGTGAAPALILAFACALTWAGYSVASRSLGDVPSETVVIFCLATAALSLPVHLAAEQTLWPTDARGWLAVAALGIGPVGIAFFTWDIGMKRGDIQLLGVASYAAPLLSTTALILAGIAPPTPILFVSAVLIAGGAVLAARARGGG
jgi:drug/metabolite transporter (DMT)-like permease